MLKKILPFTKKDSEKLYNSLNEITETNKVLQNMIVENKNENIELKEKINNLELQINKLISHEKEVYEHEVSSYKKIINLIEIVKEDNIYNNKEVIHKIDRLNKNYDLKINKNISEVYKEIHNIVKLMNKSMFLEIVANHKESLDRLLKMPDSKKEKNK